MRDIELHQLFPKIYSRVPKRPMINLGEFGVTTMPRLFGCKIKYFKDKDPLALPFIPDKLNPMDLKVPDVEEGLMWLAEEYDKIRFMYEKRVKILPPDLQGPLNIAFKLCGDKVFQYIRIPSKKEIGHHIFKVITETYIEVHKWIRKLLNLKPICAFIISECTSLFISPATYEEFNLKYNSKAAKELGSALIHSCGKITNQKLDLFKRTTNFSGAELGFGTDLKYARSIFIGDHENPLLIIARIDPKDMLNDSSDEIRRKVNWILENGKGGPLNLTILGVPCRTPFENIRTFHNTCRAYNNELNKKAKV